MNLFQKYGIKEVADVVFYSINKIGDEVMYTPVLYLDTLKVSTAEKTAETVSAEGGKGNKKLISWNFGKEITLNLEDALFSPASMSLMWGGKLDAKLSPYTSAIAKINIANKYGKLNYSTKAYPSPALTDEEWEIIFKAATDAELISGLKKDDEDFTIYWKAHSDDDEALIQENRTILRKRYFKRLWTQRIIDASGTESDASPYKILKLNSDSSNIPLDYYSYSELRTNYDGDASDIYYEWLMSQAAMPDKVVNKIMTYIHELNDIETIDTEMYDMEVVDRMEKCIVTKRDGLKISTAEQKKNLMRYYRDDRSSSYTIYYDAKTMLPLLSISDEGFIRGWDVNDIGDESQYDRDMDDAADQDYFKIRIGTSYYKWTRTVKYKEGKDDGILGKTFVINADTFPDAYKIVGETYIRDQKTGHDQRCQIVIHRAKVNSDTNLTLEAEGDPTTFSMSVEVLTPPNDIMMEIKTFEVDEDNVHGGTLITPQKSRYTYTATTIENDEAKATFDNPEIY